MQTFPVIVYLDGEVQHWDRDTVTEFAFWCSRTCHYYDDLQFTFVKDNSPISRDYCLEAVAGLIKVPDYSGYTPPKSSKEKLREILMS